MSLFHIPIVGAAAAADTMDPKDSQRLRAAEGYLELGLPLEANAELDEITAELRALPVVLALRLQVYLLAGRWEGAAMLARHFAKEIEPENAQHWISWAYATRRAESLKAAEAILLEAEPLHPKEAMLHFNLACYAAQMGQLQEAEERLKRAIELDEKCKLLAVEEPDLEPIW